jgi:thiol-disulfide isomerase/thioredoxin
MKPHYFGYILPDDDSSQGDTDISILRDVLDKYGDKLEAVMSSKSGGERIINEGQLSKVKPPFFFIVNTTHAYTERWFIDDETAHNSTFVIDFIDRVLQGKENRTICYPKFSPEPAEVRLRQVTAFDFAEKVLDPKIDALVVLTATWCGHCKRFKPVLQATAELFNETSGVAFYWMDGPSNDVPTEFPSWTGFPTMFIWPAGEENNVTTFSGNRTVDGIIDFVEKYGGNKFERPVYNVTQIEERIEELRKQGN